MRAEATLGRPTLSALLQRRGLAKLVQHIAGAMPQSDGLLKNARVPSVFVDLAKHAQLADATTYAAAAAYSSSRNLPA